MKLLTLLNGPVEENCYVLSAGDPNGGSVVIDPGSSPAQLLASIQAANLKPSLILATHAHFDHVGAVAALAKAYGARFAMHPKDLGLLQTLPDTYAFYGMGDTTVPALDLPLTDGQWIEAAGLRLQVFHTPGHTLGGCCYYEPSSGSLFSGDTLFRRSIGRSDFEGGDARTLVASIRTRLFTLPDETKVYPGHGAPTTLGEEKRENEFLA